MSPELVGWQGGQLGRYRRRAHYRRSPNGGRHFVRAHSVNRGGGHQHSTWRPPGSLSPRSSTPTNAPTLVWVTPMPSEPNATCPVCGARVYFWQNQAGSRVWFDALGKPWPRHPCLSLPTFRWSNRREHVLRARTSAEGPVSAPRKVEVRGSDGAGCGCLFLLGAVFLIACVINWWRLVFVDAPGHGGVWGTVAATVVVIALLVTGERVLTASSRRRALDRALRLREGPPPPAGSAGDPPTS